MLIGLEVGGWRCTCAAVGNDLVRLGVLQQVGGKLLMKGYNTYRNVGPMQEHTARRRQLMACSQLQVSKNVTWIIEVGRNDQWRTSDSTFVILKCDHAQHYQLRCHTKMKMSMTSWIRAVSMEVYI